jgi:hypothetical protein
MARLVRGDQVFDAWIEDRTDGVWLCAREGDGPAACSGPRRSPGSSADSRTSCRRGCAPAGAACAIDMLLRAGPTPPLRTLQIQRDALLNRLGDLSELGTRYPLLEDVELAGSGDAQLDTLHLPRARRFAYRTSTMDQATAAAA